MMRDRWDDEPYDFRRERTEALADDPPRQRIGSDRVLLDEIPDLTADDYRQSTNSWVWGESEKWDAAMRLAKQGGSAA